MWRGKPQVGPGLDDCGLITTLRKERVLDRILNFRGRLTGLFWLALSIFICAMSVPLGIGTFKNPGPGFVLFWAGMILGILGILLWFLAGSKERGNVKTWDLWKGLKWDKVIFVLISLFIYILLLPAVGYLVTTSALLFFLFSIIERSALWVRIVFALTATVTTYIIFYLWLDVQLPRGIF